MTVRFKGFLAPGHCTGEPTFAHFKGVWGPKYSYAGVGTVIDLPLTIDPFDFP